MRKTYFISAVVAASALVAVGGAALAAGGGFGSPGTYKFHDISAAAGLTDSTGTQLFISVDRGMQTFKVRGVNGPPTMVGPETVLTYTSFNPDGSFAFGCFVIPDSSFVVGASLATATLKVDPSVEQPCPGVPVPSSAGGRPGLSNVSPEAGGGGGGGGDTPITANLIWTSNGAVWSYSFVNSSKCQNAVVHTTGSSQNTSGTVSGSVSVLADLSTVYSSVGESDNTNVINGTFSNACIGI